MTTVPPTAVVGAGYAGMAAAVTLAGADVPVTVFEAAAVPGGRARRVSAGGESFDNGQHLLVGAYRQLYALMREVGVPSDAVLRMPLELRYARGFALRALYLPAPLGLLGGLLLARGLPMRERLGAVRFMLAMRRARFRVDPGTTVAALLEAHAQDGHIGHYLWRPLCVSALNTPAERASANRFLAALRDTLDGDADASDLLFPRIDLSRMFPEPAATYVEARGGRVLTRHRVRSLRRDGAQWMLDGVPFGRVVLACPPREAARLLEGITGLEAALAPLRAYTYEPIVTCFLQYPSGVRLPLPMLGLDGGHIQWVFDRGVLLGERGRLACVISAGGPHLALGHDALAAACHRELAAVLPRLPAPTWSRVIAEKRATVACTPGLHAPPTALPLPGLYLAGDYVEPEYPATLEAAVRSGVAAAREALATVHRD